ncbi:hypothetical protein PF008_g8340 [Phytophthora fragariae]|uniref:Uncharacterized protein n=1 Tax=Phytophthora fragariae TaxID=53985 RepID=A0A6G0S1G3_9STRA|nr:hypothetical protein PF008_g8340 [Phytophthora fragariae]
MRIGRRHPMVVKLRKLWKEFNRARNYRADRLRQQTMKRLRTGCIEYDGEPRQFHPETLLEPSYLQYSFEVLEWVPKTANWVAEMAEKDARHPWCNCWIDNPAIDPINTTFAPYTYNPVAPLFVPRVVTCEEVASSVVVVPSLPAPSVSARWVTEFAVGDDADPPDEESKDSSGDQGAAKLDNLIHAASSSAP